MIKSNLKEMIKRKKTKNIDRLKIIIINLNLMEILKPTIITKKLYNGLKNMIINLNLMEILKQTIITNKQDNW